MQARNDDYERLKVDHARLKEGYSQLFKRKETYKQRWKEECKRHDEQWRQRVTVLNEKDKLQSSLSTLHGGLRQYLNQLAESGNDSALELFLTNVRDISFLDDKGLAEETALMEAAKVGHLSTCQLLINKLGQKLLMMGLIRCADGKNQIDCTALDMAAQNGHLEVCKLLIDAGLGITHENYMFGTLSLAVNGMHANVVRYFLEPAIKAKLGISETDLNEALIEADTYELIELLVESGADVNAKSRYYYSVLCDAISRADEDSMRYLLKKGASIEDVDYRDLLSGGDYKGLNIFLGLLSEEKKQYVLSACKEKYDELEENESQSLLEQQSQQDGYEQPQAEMRSEWQQEESPEEKERRQQQELRELIEYKENKAKFALLFQPKPQTAVETNSTLKLSQ